MSDKKPKPELRPLPKEPSSQNPVYVIKEADSSKIETHTTEVKKVID
jgi:hypothetical protein